jgi:hypothetical protein
MEDKYLERSFMVVVVILLNGIVLSTALAMSNPRPSVSEQRNAASAAARVAETP